MTVEDELTPLQQSIAEELSRLVDPPSAATCERLMAAVRAVRLPTATARRTRPSLRRRVLLVGAASLAFVGIAFGALAASAHARPGSPAYALRLAGERLRLTVADATGRERLRLDFARDRIAEAADAAQHGDRSVADHLLQDSRDYLQQTKNGLSDVSGDDRAGIANEIGSAEQQQGATQAQVDRGDGQHSGTAPSPPESPPATDGLPGAGPTGGADQRQPGGAGSQGPSGTQVPTGSQGNGGSSNSARGGGPGQQQDGGGGFGPN